MKGICTLLFFCIVMNAHAEFAQPNAHGFHWYSRDKKETIQKHPIPANVASQASPYEKLMAMRKQTLNKLARALIEPSFDATYDYMKAQQIYAKNNQQFVRFWQQVLLVHPELDHTLNFPTDNSAVAMRNDSMNGLMEKVIKEGAKKYGLILFYRYPSDEPNYHIIPTYAKGFQ